MALPICLLASSPRILGKGTRTTQRFCDSGDGRDREAEPRRGAGQKPRGAGAAARHSQRLRKKVGFHLPKFLLRDHSTFACSAAIQMMPGLFTPIGTLSPADTGGTDVADTY